MALFVLGAGAPRPPRETSPTGKKNNTFVIVLVVGLLAVPVVIGAFAAVLLWLYAGQLDDEHAALVADQEVAHSRGHDSRPGAAARPEKAAEGSMEDPSSPIAVNLIKFVPPMLDGVQARRVQQVSTRPEVHGLYQYELKKTYNVFIEGPSETEAARRASYGLLGKDETKTVGAEEHRGFKIGAWEGQRTNEGLEKSEAVLLVNPYVLVRVIVSPAADADEPVKLLEELDLEGISKLR